MFSVVLAITLALARDWEEDRLWVSMQRLGQKSTRSLVVQYSSFTSKLRTNHKFRPGVSLSICQLCVHRPPLPLAPTPDYIVFPENCSGCPSMNRRAGYRRTFPIFGIFYTRRSKVVHQRTCSASLARSLFRQSCGFCWNGFRTSAVQTRSAL